MEPCDLDKVTEWKGNDNDRAIIELIIKKGTPLVNEFINYNPKGKKFNHLDYNEALDFYGVYLQNLFKKIVGINNELAIMIIKYILRCHYWAKVFLVKYYENLAKNPHNIKNLEKSYTEEVYNKLRGDYKNYTGEVSSIFKNSPKDLYKSLLKSWVNIVTTFIKNFTEKCLPVYLKIGNQLWYDKVLKELQTKIAEKKLTDLEIIKAKLHHITKLTQGRIFDKRNEKLEGINELLGLKRDKNVNPDVIFYNLIKNADDYLIEQLNIGLKGIKKESEELFEKADQILNDTINYYIEEFKKKVPVLPSNKIYSDYVTLLEDQLLPTMKEFLNDYEEEVEEVVISSKDAEERYIELERKAKKEVEEELNKINVDTDVTLLFSKIEQNIVPKYAKQMINQNKDGYYTERLSYALQDYVVEKGKERQQRLKKFEGRRDAVKGEYTGDSSSDEEEEPLPIIGRRSSLLEPPRRLSKSRYKIFFRREESPPVIGRRSSLPESPRRLSESRYNIFYNPEEDSIIKRLKSNYDLIELSQLGTKYNVSLDIDNKGWLDQEELITDKNFSKFARCLNEDKELTPNFRLIYLKNYLFYNNINPIVIEDIAGYFKTEYENFN